MNARGIRIARAIELKSESKILRYQKQTRILLFFRGKLTYSIGARNFTKIVEIVMSKIVPRKQNKIYFHSLQVIGNLRKILSTNLEHTKLN